MQLNPVSNATRLRRGILHPLAAAALALVLVVPPRPAFADDGRFEIIRLSARVTETGWLVDARVDLELGEDAIAALESGVVLRIRYQYEVERRRRFMTDIRVTQAEQRFDLAYLSLSQRYLVRRLDEGSQQSYATLSSALRYLGQVRDFELRDPNADADDRNYRIAMRAVLERVELPGPLQFFVFWAGDFSQASDWYRWRPKL